MTTLHLERRGLPLFLAFTIFLTGFSLCAQERISLAGDWSVRLDADSSFYNSGAPPQQFTKKINLPGTTDEARLGIATHGSDYGILTRAYKHIGPAWYQRQIHIPSSWKQKNITLFLERVLWESKVFIDGKERSTLSPLYVPHQHSLGVLKPGAHTLTICINNDLIHNIGDKGHGYTEYTQSIWNGIVGRIELRPESAHHIQNVKTYPDAAQRSVGLKISLNPNASLQPLIIDAALTEAATNKTVKQQRFSIRQPKHEIELSLNDLPPVKTWDEFDPHLYNISITLKHGKKTTNWSGQVGFRKLSTTPHKIVINDKKTFIRGNLDCVHFPLTGYPSCNVEDWITIFKKYKSYGLNTVRFHSWTPPEAAFIAADQLGIYIQTEIIWLDWWMAGERKERPEMNTKGFPQGLGKNPNADAFVQAEMKRVIDTYGNHPSFAFFCIGNELGNSDFDVMQQWISKMKSADPRRLYAVSTARKIMPVDDYMVTHNIPNVGRTYGYSLNKTDAGLEANYSKAQIPIIAHEVGQAPVYPEWKEIDKYKGVLKARNLEGFKAVAIQNGIVDKDEDFHKATGALQQLLYKNLIENITLAPSSAGFQMLSMTDYQGQGEALIGWLDCFWDDKGTTPPGVFKSYSNAVVPLIRTSSFTYTLDDTLKLNMELANYSQSDLHQKLQWEITDLSGKPIDKGMAGKDLFPQGALTTADSLALPLANFPRVAGEYKFRLFLEDNSYSNDWSFFVFPPARALSINTDGIYISKEWDTVTDSILNAGGKVLLLADKLGTKESSAPVSFTPLFWSASFFPGQSNETLGSFINHKSEIFRHFPTDYFTNWQWFKLTAGAKYFKLSDMPKRFQPLVQPVSDFHYNEKLGSIFETKVGKGKLLICGYALQQKDNAYATQLLYSMIAYMKSDAFNPQDALPIATLKKVLAKTPEAIQAYPLPDAFRSAALYIKAGNASEKDKQWQASEDIVAVNKNYKYAMSAVNITKYASGAAWSGKNISINLVPPAGVKGYIYLHLLPTGQPDVEGRVTIEGRELETGNIPAKGKWIKIFMMREDTNDGKVQVQLKSGHSSPLLFDELVVMEEE
ncbi:glycoside hydrolase family 2 TIM barrel-domain containing protein [Niabella insulamsoli]|uniref:glycoside hydrolase family 2 TIM barrel-domain containing protein n=1 Tax=Niabella insulamsoli TaxID=3144874 RepID=UPI0031FC7483